MEESRSVFLDSDILFRYFAISEEKRKLYNKNKTTGNGDLDAAIGLIQRIDELEQFICISEFSLLELICILNRLKSAQKIPKIVEILNKIADILPLTDNLMNIAWYLGARFKLHSGDALHISFCLLNDIDFAYLSDGPFYRTFLAIQKDYEKNGTTGFREYYNSLFPTHFIPGILLKKYLNLHQIQILKI